MSPQIKKEKDCLLQTIGRDANVPYDEDSRNAPIKYESPYYAEQAQMFTPQPQTPSHKRQRSGSDSQDAAEKRQRVEPPSSDADDFAAILARTTASVTQQLGQSANIQTQHASPPQQSHFQSRNEQMGGAGLTSGFTSDPNLYMRILSLPILESLILSTLALGPYHETIKIVTDPECELGQAYTTLKSLFDQTKKIYSQQGPFLSADELNIKEPEHRSTIRTTNLATFVSSVFGGQDVGFYELNDHFIVIFTPEGEPLGREAGQLYLNLKTQMYLSASSQEEQDRTKEDILEDLFPLSIDQIVSARHPGQPLAQSELDFIKDCNSRREYLMAEPSDAESILRLSEMFAWEDFLRRLSAHLNQAYEPLLAPYMERHALTAPASPVREASRNATQMQMKTTAMKSIEHDFAAEAERAAQTALQTLGYAPSPNQNGGSSQYHIPTQNGSFTAQYTDTTVPYPSQSAPTQVLYEKARQAAVSKTNPGKSGRPGVASQRRPWSTEEENALMAGLDYVKGPHWSQILALYGPKGSVNEILKDRNQVQLKDKARNLKLFFLKSNIEVPYYLQSVTGELKTRAPSQAARKEAEERARIQGDEEQARFNGILTLAGGIQGPGPMNGAGSATPVNLRPSDSPEELHVVEPPSFHGFTPNQITDDEQLRQSLMAATAAATASVSSSSPTGLQANGSGHMTGNNQLSI
ncbi:hypothetical protein G7Y89_g5099 [Cudoniella acicularis]|uniref:Telomere repeat-binding factor dimerisation domain-containing protein n=1 Tax=Cudoniella acicularis TaxID=354080 RepID=A0A8H4RN46_9HELO|nr:hypothetical protein G7Y89_g5099 [Cudoniella acicularis]